MSEKKSIEALISGGQATAGPPLGPALGPLGVNVMAIVRRINELTKDYAGMKVPVKINVNTETKDFEVIVGTPTTSALIVKEIGVEKGSGSPKMQKIGNLTIEQVAKIARLKSQSSLASSRRAAAKEIVGSCLSMGVTVEGKDAKEVLKEIDDGRYDVRLEEEQDRQE
jgi:large subunit ribosomal protein L11